MLAAAPAFVPIEQVVAEIFAAIPALDRLKPPPPSFSWVDFDGQPFEDIAALVCGVNTETTAPDLDRLAPRSQRSWRDILSARDRTAHRIIIAQAIDQLRAGHLAEPLVRVVAELRWVHRAMRCGEPDNYGVLAQPAEAFALRYLVRLRFIGLPVPQRHEDTAAIFKIATRLDTIWHASGFDLFVQRRDDLEPQRIDPLGHVLCFDAERNGWVVRTAPSPRPHRLPRELRQLVNRPPRVWDNLAIRNEHIKPLIRSMRRRIKPPLPSPSPAPPLRRRARDDERAFQWALRQWLPKQPACPRQNFDTAFDNLRRALAKERERRVAATHWLWPLGKVTQHSAFREIIWPETPWHETGSRHASSLKLGGDETC